MTEEELREELSIRGNVLLTLVMHAFEIFTDFRGPPGGQSKIPGWVVQAKEFFQGVHDD